MDDAAKNAAWRSLGMTIAKPLRFLLVASAVVAARAPLGQSVPCVPFQPGERFEYAVHVARMGASGRGAMWIEDTPAMVRGSSTLVLRFETAAGVGPVRGSDRTASWLDIDRMASLRFVKHERHLLSTRDDSVEMFAETRRWSAADGTGGESPSGAPLDELSFIYFLRTLPLADTTYHAYIRHFDAERNPATIRVLRRDTLRTSAGTFATILVELRVHDPRHYHGEGVIRINLSDDVRRIPVRIESRMPVFGVTVLTLQSFVMPTASDSRAARSE